MKASGQPTPRRPLRPPWHRCLWVFSSGATFFSKSRGLYPRFSLILVREMCNAADPPPMPVHQSRVSSPLVHLFCSYCIISGGEATSLNDWFLCKRRWKSWCLIIIKLIFLEQTRLAVLYLFIPHCVACGILVHQLGIYYSPCSGSSES